MENIFGIGVFLGRGTKEGGSEGGSEEGGEEGLDEGKGEWEDDVGLMCCAMIFYSRKRGIGV